MNGDVMGPFMFFLFLGAVILIPLYLRNRLQQKQLDAVATAIEKGIDPERIRASLPVSEKTADVNGNWKASLILMGLGLVYILLFALPLIGAAEGENAAENIVAFVPGVILLVIGGILMHIHRTVVGKVITVNTSGLNGHKVIEDNADSY